MQIKKTEKKLKKIYIALFIKCIKIMKLEKSISEYKKKYNMNYVPDLILNLSIIETIKKHYNNVNIYTSKYNGSYDLNSILIKIKRYGNGYIIESPFGDVTISEKNEDENEFIKNFVDIIKSTNCRLTIFLVQIIEKNFTHGTFIIHDKKHNNMFRYENTLIESTLDNVLDNFFIDNFNNYHSTQISIDYATKNFIDGAEMVNEINVHENSRKLGSCRARSYNDILEILNNISTNEDYDLINNHKQVLLKNWNNNTISYFIAKLIINEIDFIKIMYKSDTNKLFSSFDNFVKEINIFRMIHRKIYNGEHKLTYDINIYYEFVNGFLINFL